MTANQIAFQQMLVDKQSKEAQARKAKAEAASQEMSNELQRLETDVRKYYDYNVGDMPSSGNQWLENTFGRGLNMAKKIVGFLLPEMKFNFGTRTDQTTGTTGK